MKQKKIVFVILMLFCSIVVNGYEWKGMSVKIWSEMTEQEILDEFSTYIQNRTFYCEIIKDDINYKTTTTINGYTYNWLTALDGSVTNKTPDKFLGFFRLCDKPSITGPGSTWNDTTIYDEAGIKYAREVVFKNWKKQFESIDGELAIVQKSGGYTGKINIPEKISVLKSQKVALKYIDDDYYNDFWTASVSLTGFAREGGGDAYVVGSFKVTDVSQFNASREGLMSVSFPSTIEEGFPSLEDCVNLEKVEFSRHARGMPDLKGCKSLKYVRASASTVSEGEFRLPSTLEYLSSFEGCESLKKITIPDNVKTLNQYAYFKDCISLESISLGKGIPYISSSMFEGCTSLPSIEIPSQITSINDYAFAGCTSLSSIFIPKQITFIGSYSFESCTNLENISFEEDSHLESIYQGAFSSCPKITLISLPVPLKSIANYAFGACSALEIIVLPSTLESIEDGAFSGCSNLLDIYANIGPFLIGQETHRIIFIMMLIFMCLAALLTFTEKRTDGLSSRISRQCKVLYTQIRQLVQERGSHLKG